MANATLAFDILTRYKDTGADKAARDMDRLGKSGSRMGSTLKKAGAAGAVALAAGTVLAARALVGMTKSAIEDEAAQKRLALALHNNAGATKGQVSAVESWITAQGKALGVTDDELRPALGRLVTATHNVGKAQKLASLAMDVSAGTGKSLKAVTEAMTKAQNGNVGALSRLGINTKTAKGETISMDEAVKRMSETFGGQASKNANTLEGKMRRLQVQWDEAKEAIGARLIPVLTRFSDWVLNKGVPAVTSFANEMRNGRGAAGVLGDAFKRIMGVVKSAVDLFTDLPGPVKETGIQAAVAALVLPRLAAGVTLVTSTLTLNIARLQQWRAEMTASTTRAQVAATMMNRLGAAAAAAAGVAGMVALTQGANESAESLSSWGKTVGGSALLGASLGSVIPGVGTAIGALGGAAVGTSVQLWRMSEAEQAAVTGAKEAEPKFASWSSTLDQTTGAITRNTRALALQKLQTLGVIGQAQALGINTKDLIGSMLGQEGAQKRVNAAMRGNTDILKGLSYQNLNSFLRDNASALRGQQAELRRNNRDIETWGQALRGLPRGIKVSLRNENYKVTLAEVRALARQYDRNPKRLVTRLELAGVTVVRRGAKDTEGALKGVGKATPNLQPWLRGLTSGLSDGQINARRGARGVGNELRAGTGKAKADLSGFHSSLNTGITNAKGFASSGGRQTGNSLGQGMYNGVDVWGGAIAGRAAAIVRAAVAAARRAADAHSPSRETDRLGQDMGQGLADGLARSKPKAKAHGRGLALAVRDGLIGGLQDGKQKLSNVLEKVVAEVRASTDKVKGLVADRNTFAAGFRGFSSSVFGRDFNEPATEDTVDPETGETIAGTPASPTTAAKIIAAQAEERKKALGLQRDTARLIKMGLSKDLIRQMAESGESGIANIHALAQGTTAQVQQFNADNAATAASLNAAGMTAGNALYGDKIKDAEREKRQDERVLKRLRAFAHELNKEPSKVEVVVRTPGGKEIQRELLALKRQTKHDLGLA